MLFTALPSNFTSHQGLEFKFDSATVPKENEQEKEHSRRAYCGTVQCPMPLVTLM